MLLIISTYRYFDANYLLYLNTHSRTRQGLFDKICEELDKFIHWSSVAPHTVFIALDGPGLIHCQHIIYH